MGFVLDNHEVQLVISDSQPRTTLAFRCADRAVAFVDDVEVRFDREATQLMLDQDLLSVEVEMAGRVYSWSLDSAEQEKLVDNIERYCDAE